MRLGHTDPRGCRRCPAWQESAVSQSGAALLELSRPECGTVAGTSSPPDVRFAGKYPAVTRAPPWITVCPLSPPLYCLVFSSLCQLLLLLLFSMPFFLLLLCQTETLI